MPVLWPALPRISPGVQRLPLSGWLRPLPAIRSDTSPVAGLSRGILQADVRCDLLEAFDGRGDELIRTRLARRSNHSRDRLVGHRTCPACLSEGRVRSTLEVVVHESP